MLLVKCPFHSLVRLVSFVAALGLLSRESVAAPTQPDTLSYAAIRAHVIQYEGYRFVPYPDGPGWSVGAGHSLTANMEPRKARYTVAEVERYLRQDIAWSWDAARAGITDFDSLPQDAQLVAIGVAITVGRTGFERFSAFRFALSHRAFNAALTELGNSRWRRQVSLARANAYLRTLHSL